MHTPAAPGPPRTQLPKTQAETQAELPKPKSAIGKTVRRDSPLACVQRLNAAAKERREAREGEGAGSSGAGPSGLSPDDDVEYVETRTREDRDEELRAQAVDLDA